MRICTDIIGSSAEKLQEAYKRIKKYITKIKNMEFESSLLPGIDAKRPLVIAGPCSAETEEQVMNTARELAATGVKIFRAGVWKPRTKPGGFEGVGSPALKWMMEAEKETGMYMATEVATEKHVYEALKYGIDMLDWS